ncbi:hypothetical protein [Vannielia sp.]|uniref:hypothetical protein n=1 Tax=Vannielia sp. TaxID=2813045 RepID=UPI00261812C2|nr:hypothetical protein [Vannielia sp.]MDF1873667.1 hypothetical protein [Vannielia sp.]
MEGLYELVGRGPEGRLWQEPVRLKARGERLEVEICADPDAGEAMLVWERKHEAWRLVGRIRGVELSCNWAMTGDNTPVLICVNRDGARLMGWPEAGFGGRLICD